MKDTRKLIAAVVAVAALAAPTSALGQASSSEELYNPPLDLIDPPADPNGAPPDNSTKAASSGGSDLPFTGLDLGLMAAAGVAIGGMGLGMRRLTRRPDSA